MDFSQPLHITTENTKRPVDFTGIEKVVIAGRLKRIVTWKSGLRHGMSKYYDENENLIRTDNWHEGRKFGEIWQACTSERLGILGFWNRGFIGEFRQFDRDGVLLQRMFFVRPGVLQGWLYHLDDTTVTLQYFKRGRIIHSEVLRKYMLDEVLITTGLVDGVPMEMRQWLFHESSEQIIHLPSGVERTYKDGDFILELGREIRLKPPRNIVEDPISYWFSLGFKNLPFNLKRFFSELPCPEDEIVDECWRL